MAREAHSRQPCTPLVAAMLAMLVAASMPWGTAAVAPSALKAEWQALVASSDRAFWADQTGARNGLKCDPTGVPDTWKGCVTVFVADAHDDFTVSNLPTNEMNDFQNSLHYWRAWNAPRTHATGFPAGFKARTLPVPGDDVDPVCYVGTVNYGGEARTVLGYEEGNGDSLLPCPGTNGSFPFSQAQINDALASCDEGGQGCEVLTDMCMQCYKSVCEENSWRRDPRTCGGASEGGVDVGASTTAGKRIATGPRQTGPAYHCHVAIQDGNTCDYVQYTQHEVGRGYGMDSFVACGWREALSSLQLTHCDCTAASGRNNNCKRQECLDFAMEGVVCGNCQSCNNDYAFDAIFGVPGIPKAPSHAGDCALALQNPGASAEQRRQMEAKCSRALFCRGDEVCATGSCSSGCQFHCSLFGGLASEAAKCPKGTSSGARRLLASSPSP